MIGICLAKAVHFIVRQPRSVLAACVLVTLLCAWMAVSRTTFDSDIAGNMRSDSQAYAQFVALENDFHGFSQDELILVQASDLGDPETYEALSNFVIDLQLLPGVEAVASLFSFTAFDGPAQHHPERTDASSAGHSQTLSELIDVYPVAHAMVSADRSATLVILMLERAVVDAPPEPLPETAEAILLLADQYTRQLSVTIVGIPAIERTVATLLAYDQLVLAGSSVLACLAVALAVFRSWTIALVSAVPPTVGLVWYFGFLALLDIPIDVLTTIVPTVLIVLAFSDGIHLIFAFAREDNRHDNRAEAIAAALIETVPACFTTSVTTVLAFMALGLSAFGTMANLALTASIGLGLGFVAVVTVLPTLVLVARAPFSSTETLRLRNLPWLGSTSRLLHRHYGSVVVVSMAAVALGIGAQSKVQPGFAITDYLPTDDRLVEAHLFIDEHLSGAGQLFVVVEDADGEIGLSVPDMERLVSTFDALESANALGDVVDAQTAAMLLSQAIEFSDVSPLASRSLSRGRLDYLIALPFPLLGDGQNLSEHITTIEAALQAAELGPSTHLAGLSVLIARDVPRIIDEMRMGLFLALAIIAIVTCLFTRSIFLGLASVVPNLLPILGIMLWLFATDQALSMTGIIALTVALGIAVDDSIHLLNRYCRAGRQNAQRAVEHALGEAGPPMAVTTLVLVSGLSVTQLSSLPTVGLFGVLVIAAQIIALAADLCVLPAFLRLQKNK